MPVVKKIKLTDVNLESWRMITNPSNYPIEKVHNQVVEFIKQQKQESMKTFVLNQSWTSEYSEAPTNVEVTLTQDQMNTILNHVDYLRSLGEFDGTIIQMTYLDIQVVDSEYRIGHSVFSIGQYRMYVEVENKWNNEDRAEYEGIYVCDLKDTRTSHALTEKTWEEKYKPLVNHIEREKQDSSVADEDLCGWNGWLYETYGEDLEYIVELARHSQRVWTIIEGDDDAMYYSAGFHSVNRLGYIVTENPWATGVEEVELENDMA